MCDWFGRDWCPCAVATLRTDTLPCVSFQFRVAWYLCAVTWLSCDQFWTVKRIERCTTVVHIYILYLSLYVCVNVTRLYKRCITDPMDVVTYSGNLLGWRGANAIGNGKGSVEMSAGAPQGLGMLGKLYYRSRVSEIKVIPEYRHAHLLIIRHIPCMYALIPVLTWKFPFIYIYTLL